ncbi:hypothetical protein [Rhizobium sp. BK060]|uniref:hypothetical protein n=1 Tax=Rhizobium sp. BK060 TaxID=2587096 RepID=UPI00160EFBDD|nr:hypothetical protein [Rhizobium sp. BK060]MBB3396887.1 putative Ntn-hydrolase superfamily protein [Rhizobium sp. BK060]
MDIRPPNVDVKDIARDEDCAEAIVPALLAVLEAATAAGWERDETLASVIEQSALLLETGPYAEAVADLDMPRPPNQKQ